MKIKCGCCGAVEEVVHTCSVCKSKNKLRTESNRKISELKNNIKELKCTCHEGIDEKKDYTLKEWVNFDYKKYLDKILRVVKGDKFSALKAATQEQLEAGLLTDAQISNLRNTLDLGFERGWSLRTIAEEIKKNVNLKDRYVLKNGKIVLTGDRKPRLAVSAEHRPLMIARTETVRLSNLGAINHFESEGAEYVSWVATYGQRTCPFCASMDGKIFTIKESYEMETAGIFPGIIHVGCRCSMIPL